MHHQHIVFDIFSDGSSGLSHQISSSVRLETSGSKTKLSDVSSVWWRQKPKLTIAIDSPQSLYDSVFIKQEWKQLTDFLSSEMPSAFAVNNPENTTLANNKLVHLKVGQECGFTMPKSLVSNDVESIVDFISDSRGNKCIYKPLTPYMPPSGLITFTSLVDASSILSNQRSIRAAPGVFQVYVEKQYETRVTVVGDEIFSARINSAELESTQVDWRQDSLADIYNECDMGPEFNERLLTLHRQLGLYYAAYDFIVTHENEVVLLDINPTGQWMWLENRLKFPISERIAAALANPPKI